MAIDIEEKTEQPTERRRRLAREQGQGPRSSVLTLSVRLLGIAAALQFFGSPLAQDCARLVSASLQRPLARSLTVEMATAQSWEALAQIGSSFMGCCACVLIAGLIVQWLQIGWRFQTADLLPDLTRLSPARGFSKLWSLDNSAQALIALIKYLAVLLFGGWYIWSSLERTMTLADWDAGLIAEMVGTSLVQLAWQIGGLLLLFGLADYGYQYWKFERSLRMSPEEVREEARQQSADPQWKQQRRELWKQQLATQPASGKSP